VLPVAGRGAHALFALEQARALRGNVWVKERFVEREKKDFFLFSSVWRNSLQFCLYI
jgi:hypothetical protein